jgi:hypothetical protein
LSPIPSTYSAIKTPENTEEESDGPEPAYDEGTQMEYSLISCTAQVYRNSNKKITCKNFIQYRYCLIIQNI